MDFNEKTVQKRTVYDGRILSVRSDDITLPNGAPAKREVVEHNGGVCVAALTDDEELLMVRQYRYPFGRVLEEIPAGKLEKGEAHYSAGKRELLEETGAIPGRYEYLGPILVSPGYCTEVLHLYYAGALRFTEPHPDADEFLEVFRLPLGEAYDRVLEGTLCDMKTMMAVLRLWDMKRDGLL